MAANEPNLTPFSPCSFDYYPGSPTAGTGSTFNTFQNGKQAQNFRFAPGPDGPLPSIPSGKFKHFKEDFRVSN